LRLAVISPFLDRRHGTERCVIEQLERFAKLPGVEIHLYAQRVEDLAGVVRFPEKWQAGQIVWHKVPSIPGPHLLSYSWWFATNHVRRLWDARVHGLHFDLLYSPGMNALDANVISVHVLFQELNAGPRGSFSGGQVPLSQWPTVLHRKMYYALIRALERVVYPQKRVVLAAISQRSADRIAESFQRDDVAIVRHGVDTQTFSSDVRLSRRGSARVAFQVSDGQFCLLLIGNDWKNKGLDVLLRAVAACAALNLGLLVVGNDNPRNYAEQIRSLRLGDRVRFVAPSSDVLQFYSAADVYVGPSIEDAYGLPILEAMACGLPIIASVRAGASEIVRHGENGFVLSDPEDAEELAALLRRLCSDPNLCQALGREAARSASEQTWDRNSRDMWSLIQKAIARKYGRRRG
jgi:glycosyltransferase involved in cell wall biosynthesis